MSTTLSNKITDRTIPGPPNMRAAHHLISSAKEIAKAESIIIGRKVSVKSVENKILKNLRDRWFIWRVTIPVMIISNKSSEDLFLRRTNIFERSCIIWLSKRIGRLSFTSIGNCLDRDHSTVISSFRKFESGIRSRDDSHISFILDVFESEDMWYLGSSYRQLSEASSGRASTRPSNLECANGEGGHQEERYLTMGKYLRDTLLKQSQGTSLNPKRVEKDLLEIKI